MRLFRNISISCALLLLLATSAGAAGGVYQEAIAHPGRSGADRERDARSQPAAVLAFAGVQPGMTVIDLFAGGGYYSELLSYVVGDEGVVYAHTNTPYQGWVGEQYDARFAHHRLANVIPHLAEADDLRLKAGSADLALMVMSYHDLYYQDDGWPPIDAADFLAQAYRALKPGGTLIVIDHVAEAGTGSSAAQELHRIEPAFARRDLERAGFEFAGSSDVLHNPDDIRSLSSFDPQVRGRTDKFLYRFTKPES